MRAAIKRAVRAHAFDACVVEFPHRRRIEERSVGRRGHLAVGVIGALELHVHETFRLVVAGAVNEAAAGRAAGAGVVAPG